MMKTLGERLFRLAGLMFLLAMPWVPVAAYSTPQLGKHYIQVPQPQPAEDPRKIEILEAFSYACPHCFDLEPEIAQWARKLPKDAVFRRLPVVGKGPWLPLAKLYFALQITGDLERLHGDVFNAIHVQDVRLADEKVMADWVAQHGVDPKKFKDAYNSFTLQTEVARSRRLAEVNGITSVPTLVVGGKYLTDASMAGGQQAMLGVAEYLIQLVRQEHSGKR